MGIKNELKIGLIILGVLVLGALAFGLAVRSCTLRRGADQRIEQHITDLRGSLGAAESGNVEGRGLVGSAREEVVEARQEIAESRGAIEQGRSGVDDIRAGIAKLDEAHARLDDLIQRLQEADTPGTVDVEDPGD